MIAAAREFGMLPHEYAAKTPDRLHDAYMHWLRIAVWGPLQPTAPRGDEPQAPPFLGREPTRDEVRWAAEEAKKRSLARVGLRT